MFAYMKLSYGIEFSPRIQAHTAQPITDNPLGTGTGAPCSSNNSRTRVVNGIDCGRNHLRKGNGYFSFDWRGTRPFHFGPSGALAGKWFACQAQDFNRADYTAGVVPVDPGKGGRISFL